MPKVSKINELPDFKVLMVDISQCEPAPFYPLPELSAATEQLIAEQLQHSHAGIVPFWGVVRDGLAQIFLGAYQLDALKRHQPKRMISVRVGAQEHFSAAETARLMLHTHNEFPEGDMIFRARAIEGLKHFFAFSDRQLAEYTGTSRPVIANTRRLLMLEPEVLHAVQQGRISYTIARELLTQPAKRQVELVREFSRTLLSNHKMLARIHGHTLPAADKPAATPAATTVAAKSADVVRYERMISEAMGYPAEIQPGSGEQGKLVFSPFDEAGAAHIAQQIATDIFRNRARLVLDYGSLDELEAMLTKLFPQEDDF